MNEVILICLYYIVPNVTVLVLVGLGFLVPWCFKKKQCSTGPEHSCQRDPNTTLEEELRPLIHDMERRHAACKRRSLIA